ncbi:MAG: aromatic amino acid lyase, partial [Boseongicola sp.]
MSTILIPESTGLIDLEAIWRGQEAVILDPACKASVEASASKIAVAASGDAPVYGVNTGFGKLAAVRIPTEDTEELQRNLILSHCCGVGSLLDPSETRLMMALKLLSLGRGASGVRWDVCKLIEGMLNAGVVPVIPSQGSVGASGDLAPLAHLAAVMIGEGEAVFNDTRLPGGVALERAGLVPVTLGPKEGLALINGTQFSTALALGGVFDAFRLTRAVTVTSAMTTDAIMGSTQPLRAEIHALRGHRGQIDIADAMAALMQGSEIRESHREDDTRVQDPYCIRCQPQVTG